MFLTDWIHLIFTNWFKDNTFLLQLNYTEKDMNRLLILPDVMKEPTFYWFRDNPRIIINFPMVEINVNLDQPIKRIPN